jgi:hypothetical protein
MSYIPGSDSEFDAFFSTLLNYATPKIAASPSVWPHIPLQALTDLSKLFDGWDEAYGKTKGLHTPADTERKNEARKAGETGLRYFVQRYLIWDPVTEADRLAMGLPPHDLINTPEGKPVIHVGFTLAIHQIYEILLRFWVLETGRGHVPKNMNGVVVYSQVSDTPITNQKDLHTSQLLTSHITVLSFPPELRGKMVYVACRWENGQGVEGEWSPIQSFMIP